MWWRKRNVCGYWDCKTSIPDDEILCPEHREKWALGLIDRCPQCQRFKDIMYYKCQDCYVGRKVKTVEVSATVPEPNQKYRVEYSDEWSDGYLRGDRSFVYIIGFEQGPLQVGQTTDVKTRLSELRAQEKPSQKNPRLEYLESAANEKAAEMRVVELKRIVETNPGQIEAMILEFHHHMGEFGFVVD
ncbi:MAG: hypothetical protein V3R96_05275 [Dehalococcoidales bacterium]